MVSIVSNPIDVHKLIVAMVDADFMDTSYDRTEDLPAQGGLPHAQDEDAAADEELARLTQLALGLGFDPQGDPESVPIGNTSTSATGNEPIPEPRPIHMEDLQTSQAFINALRAASLDNGDLPPHVVERLRQPLTGVPNLADDPALAL